MNLPVSTLSGPQAVQQAYELLRAASLKSPYPSAKQREDQLDRLLRLLQRERDNLANAMSADFGGRAERQSLMGDVLMPVESIRLARGHLREWMERRPVPTNLHSLPGRAYLLPQPLGVVAIISPWNYPVSMAVTPLATALAAGNRALIKPSELSPRTSELLQKLVAEFFAPDEITVVTGGADVAQAVCALPLDHLVFTGSTAVGKLVARAAAENLVPLTLELGGKSPALVHPSYPIARFARSVASGKLFNSGQTCIAPDYALIPAGQEEAFTEAFKAQVRKFINNHDSPELTSVASDKALARMNGLLDDAVKRGARVVSTLEGEPPGRKRAPVLVFGASDQARLLQEELFAPILPVVTYERFEQAIEYINARPRPLAMYYFDGNDDRVGDVLRRTHAGGVTVNDTLLHFAQTALPFGGVGGSGYGRYRGLAGFDRLSNLKSVFEQAGPLSSSFYVGHPWKRLRVAMNVLIGGSKH